ncbi:MAG: hypothetical protein KDB07_06690, partial [Planctomycetes bacterium]|nr:hypothetical protein [Planctomycetota bacterium]
YNPTQHQAGEIAWQSNQIENDRWVVTVWPQINGGNVSYHWRTFDKVTGVVNGPNQFAGVNMTSAGFNMALPASVRHLRPSLSFTAAPSGNPVAYEGIAVALTQQDGLGQIDVWLHFLRLDPASLPPMSNQPIWQVDPLRTSVNVSNTAMQSDSANVASNAAGELAVVWRDRTTAGMIGGQNLINPQQPSPNPSALPAIDIYARRLIQNFSAASVVFGAEDAALPMSSTVNVSSSLGLDSFPDLATNNQQTFYVVWQLSSATADNVASIGANSGPMNSTFGAESTDIYVRTFTFPTGQTSINQNVGANVSRSAGTSLLPPSIRYNQTLNRVGVVFLDNTINGGIAGDAGASSVPNGPISNQVAVDDIYLVLFSSAMAQTSVTQVTSSPNREMLGQLATLGSGGWLVVWGESVSTTITDIRSRMQAFDTVGVMKTAPRQYPVQSVVPGGNPQPVWPFAVTARSTDTVCISFSMMGMPDDLKIGEPAATGTNHDLFWVYGEGINTGVQNGIVQIQTFNVNSAQAINPASAPATIQIDIALRNSSSVLGVSLTDLTLNVPVGFTSQGGPNLPISIAPGVTINLALTYDVNAAALQAGQNEFSLSTTGDIGGNLTVSTAETAISVVGTTGGIAGVQVGYTINPPQIRVGETTTASITIAVTNGGLQDLTGLSFAGAFVAGLTPANLENLVLSPNPSTVTVVAGSTQVFSGSLLVGPALASQDYRPAFTLNTSQGANTGPVTSQVTNPIQIIQGNGGQGTLPPIGGLVNAGSGGGCALIGQAIDLFLVLGFVLAALGMVRLLRSRRFGQ